MSAVGTMTDRAKFGILKIGWHILASSQTYINTPCLTALKLCFHVRMHMCKWLVQHTVDHRECSENRPIDFCYYILFIISTPKAQPLSSCFCYSLFCYEIIKRDINMINNLRTMEENPGCLVYQASLKILNWEYIRAYKE